MVLEQKPGSLGLRLPKSVDTADCLEHTVVVEAPFEQYNPATVRVYIQSQCIALEGGEEDRGSTVSIRKCLDGSRACLERHPSADNHKVDTYGNEEYLYQPAGEGLVAVNQEVRAGTRLSEGTLRLKQVEQEP